MLGKMGIDEIVYTTPARRPTDHFLIGDSLKVQKTKRVPEAHSGRLSSSRTPA